MRHAYALLGLLLVTAFVYRGVWAAPFVYEDLNFVSQNPAVLGQEPIQIGRARWLAETINRVQWRVTPSARAFHVGNVALHLVNGLLVYAVALTLTASPVGAWLASAIFLLHPIQAEAVAYVAGRTELLATLGALLAWLVAASARRGWQHALVWICVAGAISCKESAVVIVPLLVLSDLLREQALSWRRLALLLVPAGAMAVSVLVMDHRVAAPLGRWAYAATQATALWRYVGLLIVPWGFTVDHDFELVAWPVRWLSLWLLLGAASFLILLLCTVGDEDRSKRSLWRSFPMSGAVVFGGLWFLIALAPRFVLRVPETLAEHQLYLPVVGLCVAMGTVGREWCESALLRPASYRGESRSMVESNHTQGSTVLFSPRAGTDQAGSPLRLHRCVTRQGEAV